MNIVCVYIDATTGERIGYLYNKGIYSCAVTEEFAQDNNLEDSDILAYLTIPNEIICVRKDDRLYELGTEVWRFENDKWHNCTRKGSDGERDCYDCDIDGVEVDGYVFKKDVCTILNNDYALRRMLTGVEM